MHSMVEFFAFFVTNTIQSAGYAGIAFLMALESLNIPIPSEIIMPFSGFLVFNEKFNFFWVVIWGTLGNFVGSLLSYYLGFFGGRPLLKKYGKFLLIGERDIEYAEKLFQKYGMAAILFGRVLPVVRTFISFPAGLSRMNIFKFSLYTLVGSFIWSNILTYGGVVAGENWNILGKYFQKFDWVIVLAIAIGIIWWVKRHINKNSNIEIRNPKQI